MRPVRALREVALLAVSGLFVLLLSGTTSPLGPWYGGDSALFRVIGTAMAQGDVLYLDIWDHKGPVLFLFQWLAQVLIPGRLGLFAIQVLLLYASLSMITAFARRFVGPMLAIAVVACTLGYLAPAYEHGNLSEEFSMPFIVLALVILTREWVTGTRPSPWLFGLAGAAFAAVVFIRINNALPIFAAFVACFVWMLVAKRPFLRSLLFSIGGFLVVTAVIVAGFALVGALMPMLDATFLFNLRYARNDSVSAERLFANGYAYVALAGVLAPLVGGLVDAQHRRRGTFLLLGWCLAFATALALLMSSTGYFHYLQVAVPGVAVGAALALQAVTRRLQVHVLAATLAVALPLVAVNVAREQIARERSQEPAYAAAVDQILDAVPEGDRDAVYGWNLNPKYFLMAGTLPVQRYFTMQEWWGSADERVLDEALDYVETEEPRWILTSSVGDPRMQAILAEDYVEKTRNASFVLFERATG